MDNLLYSRWLVELAQQCRFARVAHSELRSSLLSFEPDRTFLFAHALVTHAVKAAQLLWPDQEDLKSFGETLRKDLGIDEKSMLRREASRGEAQHTDPDYKEWLDSLGGDGFVETNIMPRGSLDGFKSDVFQRDLDSETLAFNFRGNQWSLDKLADELSKIEKAVKRQQTKLRLS